MSCPSLQPVSSIRNLLKFCEYCTMMLSVSHNLKHNFSFVGHITIIRHFVPVKTAQSKSFYSLPRILEYYEGSTESHEQHFFVK